MIRKTKIHKLLVRAAAEKSNDRKPKLLADSDLAEVAGAYAYTNSMRYPSWSTAYTTYYRYAWK